jgi:hypothetical protein
MNKQLFREIIVPKIARPPQRFISRIAQTANVLGPNGLGERHRTSRERTDKPAQALGICRKSADAKVALNCMVIWS